MKKTDILKAIGLCSVNYKNFPEAGKEEMLVELWQSMLDDIPYTILEMAIKRHMSISVFPPTIADIRKQISELNAKNNFPTSIEAWSQVKHVIQRYGSYNEAKAMSELSGIVKKSVEYFGYRELCLSENEMADRAHFLRTYEQLVDRAKENSRLTLSLKDNINDIFYLNGGDAND